VDFVQGYVGNESTLMILFMTPKVDDTGCHHYCRVHDNREPTIRTKLNSRSCRAETSSATPDGGLSAGGSRIREPKRRHPCNTTDNYLDCGVRLSLSLNYFG
jgi:hypothetical protein